MQKTSDNSKQPKGQPNAGVKNPENTNTKGNGAQKRKQKK